jgi:RHS repeat-associated protein
MNKKRKQEYKIVISLNNISTTASTKIHLKNADAWQNEYFHKDHLGNTRVVYGYQQQVDEYKATMETPLAAREQSQFYNITSSRVTGFNRTPAGIDVTAPDKSAETNGKLSGKTIGPAKMLQVSPGDRVQLEVFARYQTGTNNGTLVSNLAGAVTATFQVVSGEAAYTALNNNVPVQAATITKLSGVPKAYLFYILFNSSYGYVQFGYVQVQSPAQAAHQQLYLDIAIPVNGYLYTYVANESSVNPNTSVYFDDFKIVHTRNSAALQVLQTNDYYPFGLVFNSYQREGAIENQYLFAGKERQDELEIGWLDFGARMYQPEIARWNGIDASSENYVNQCPYHYAGNNPVKFVDFDGNDYGVTVDRGNKTIKIEAHFLTSSKSSAAFAEHGSGKWNAQSGKNVFVAGGLKALRQGKADVYKIDISVTSEVSGGADGQGRYQSDRDQKVNQDQTGTLNSFDVETTGFVENQGGGTGSDQVDMKKGEENSSTTTHEVNHAMGIAHTGDGGNQSPSGGGAVGTGQIGETLKGVGIGGDNSTRNKTKTAGVGDGTLLNGSSNQGLGQGKVISQARYERIVRRIERREERRNQN